jgi:hypothetical protein
MGFQRQSVAESSTGRRLVNWTGGLVMAEMLRVIYTCLR